MDRTIELSAKGEDETFRIARRLGEALRTAVQEGPNAWLIGLFGPLGAGKTVFARGLVSGIDAAFEEEVRSPTFAIVDELPTSVCMVRHLDLYRLSGLLDLEGIGYRELQASPGVMIVEWAERAEGWMSEDRVEVRLDPSDDFRRIRVTACGEHARALVERAFS